METFMGYVRPDGSVGIRNHVVVFPTTACAAGSVQRIVSAVPEAVPMLHTLGCGRPSEVERCQRILTNILKSPNHYAVILVGLGCEGMSIEKMAEDIAATGKPVFYTKMQTDGGAAGVEAKATEKAREFLAEAAKCARVPVGFDKLIVGTECGASDGLSGPLANQLIGELSDWVIEEGGAAILSESIELIGAEDILGARCACPALADEVRAVIARAETQLSDAIGWENAHTVNKVNLLGGMTTIKEKALGCVRKGGSTDVKGLISYAEPIGELRGLVIQDGPGFDPESVAGLIGSGAQVVLFSTGKGNPIGFPSAPMFKIASSDDTFNKFSGNMDVNASRFLADGLDMTKLRNETKEQLIRVLNGEPTASERQGQGGLLCIQTVTSAL